MTDEQRERVEDIRTTLTGGVIVGGAVFVSLLTTDLQFLLKLIADQERTIEWHEKKPNVLMETILDIRDDD